MPHPRVVSLISSATEIVHALGLGEAQVARSHECDWPPAVLDLPRLTKPKFKAQEHGVSPLTSDSAHDREMRHEGSDPIPSMSAEIDKSIRALVEQGLAVYEVDAERLKTIAPDVILTQDQCEVCAVSLADVERAVCTWTGSQAHIISLKPHTLHDVFRDIGTVAAALGVREAGETLIRALQRRLDRVRRATEGQRVPRLAFIEWIDPPMSCGHWMPELIALAGGESLFGKAGANSPWIKWEEVAAGDPDVILVAPCGYDIETTLAEMEPLRGNALWKGLRAVAKGRVFAADGNAYFNRPGPRLVESAEILAEVLHPRIIPAMRANGYGRIVQCSSVLGLVTGPYRGAYCASKYALEALSDAMRLELAGTGIHVSLIEPGPIRTRFVEHALERFKASIDIEGSAHRETYRARLTSMAAGGKSTFKLEPEAVAAKLVHAVESARPRRRYYVTIPTYLAAAVKRFAPAAMIDHFAKKM